MKRVKGGGVLLETEEEGRIAEQIAREQPPRPIGDSGPPDREVMERIRKRMAK